VLPNYWGIGQGNNTLAGSDEKKAIQWIAFFSGMVEAASSLFTRKTEGYSSEIWKYP
jgi:hypothetical protein